MTRREPLPGVILTLLTSSGTLRLCSLSYADSWHRHLHRAKPVAARVAPGQHGSCTAQAVLIVDAIGLILMTPDLPEKAAW